MKQAIVKVIRIFGPEILLNKEKFLLAMEDIKPNNMSEIQQLMEIYTKAIAQLLYDSFLQENGRKINELILGDIIESLCKDEKKHFDSVYRDIYKKINGTFPQIIPDYVGTQKNQTSLSGTAIQKIRKSIASKKVNDSFELGRYLQNRDESETPIEWIIIKKEIRRVLAISKYALFVKPFNDEWVATSWATSSIRGYLNNIFLKEAFSDVEIGLLDEFYVPADKNTRYESVDQGKNSSDRVFLLSMKEVDELASTIRTCRPTNLLKEKINTDDNGKCRWWLRTLGYDTDCATGVYANGKVDRAGFSVNTDDAVRPVICIKLE